MTEYKTIKHGVCYGSSCIAVYLKDKEEVHLFRYSDESGVADLLYDTFGDRMCENSLIPAYIEASGWCPLASAGESYIDSDFELYALNDISELEDLLG